MLEPFFIHKKISKIEVKPIFFLDEIEHHIDIVFDMQETKSSPLI